MKSRIDTGEKVRFPKIIIDPIRHLMEKENIGVTFHDALSHIGISEEEYQKPSFTLSIDEFFAFHQWIKNKTNNKISIKDWLSYNSVTSVGLAGMGALSANNIRESILLLINYLPLYMPVMNAELVEKNHFSRLNLSMTVDLDKLNRLLLELVIGAANTIIDQVSSEYIPRTIHFIHSCSATGDDEDKLQEYEDLFGCKVIFRSYFNGIESESKWMDIKTSSPNETTLKVTRKLLDDELKNIFDSDRKFSVFINKKLNELYSEGKFPSLDELSEKIYLSRRTLIRKLANEGTSFKELKNEVWLSLAKELLVENNLPIKKIAMRTGFNSVSSFSRAFKCLVNDTPMNWRNSRG